MQIMEKSQPPTSAYNYKLFSGYRVRGRPRNRSISNTTGALKKHGYNVAEAIHPALQQELKLQPQRLTASVNM